MDRYQQDVMDFHAAMGQRLRLLPEPMDEETIELRCALIMEEAKELCEAIRANSIAQMAKEACDLHYVNMGTMVAAGIDFSIVWPLVHASNMAKANGPVRPDGKRLKPDGYVGPEAAIADLLLGGERMTQVTG